MNGGSGLRRSAVRACAVLPLFALGLEAFVTAPPETEVDNGLIRVRLYLPDARNGYYRGTRFDWSGMIGSLRYEGHEYYGPWFDKVDPAVHDYKYAAAEIIASTCSGATGPAEEFQTNGTALGWDSAKPGGTFIKIGVGVLRKDEGSYDFVKEYEIVEGGKWTVTPHKDSVDFSQELNDPSSGYGYIYHKTVRLIAGKPEMVLEHRLQNTGRHAIESAVYNHNFLVLDRQPISPDLVIKFPFPIQSSEPPDQRLAEIRGSQFLYRALLKNDDHVETPIAGFSDTPSDNDIQIENRKLGARIRMTGDHPLSHINLWSIRTVLAVEPFITMKIDPGAQFSWKVAYEYSTFAPGAK